MKRTLSAAVALLLLGAPLAAQERLSEEKLKSVLETMRQLNALPATSDGLRPRSGPQAQQQTPVSPDLIKEIGSASLEFLKKYSTGHVIYGNDNRRSYDNATATEQRAADATAVFVMASQVSADRNNTVKIASRSGGPRLCSPSELKPGQMPEPFWDQPRPGFCTGFKVGPDLVATAGHCIKPSNEMRPGDISCGDVRIVFGFRQSKSRATADRDIPASSVYRCVDVVAGQLNASDDWRIIRVDRTINAPQVNIRMEGKPPLGAPLTVVGHPSGLPVTISGGAAVQRHRATHFSADLDTYQGNSGSPVFNSDRLRAGELLVEGILVRGEDDYEQHQPCQISRRCPLFSACRGEDVTYASTLEPALRRLMRTEASKQ